MEELTIDDMNTLAFTSTTQSQTVHKASTAARFKG